MQNLIMDLKKNSSRIAIGIAVAGLALTATGCANSGNSVTNPGNSDTNAGTLGHVPNPNAAGANHDNYGRFPIK